MAQGVVQRDANVGLKVGDDIPLASLVVEALPYLLGRCDNEFIWTGRGEQTRAGCNGEEGCGCGWCVVGGPRVENLEFLCSFGALC